MTLVADRFIRFDDGTVRDLVTGEEVTLIEIALTGAAEQVARRDYCLARLDAQARGRGTAARGGGEVSRTALSAEASEELSVELSAESSGTSEVVGEGAGRDSPAPPLEDFALVDFALIGESRWIEAYRTTADAATTSGEWDGRRGWRDEVRDWMGSSVNPGNPVSPVSPAGDEGGVLAGPVIDAIAATLDGLGSRDVRRLYVKAPDSARLDTFQASIAREVRARGFIPLSASVVSSWPAIAPLLAARSIVLFGDARCVFSSFSGFGGFGDSSGSIARAVALLHRTACAVAAIVARVCDHVNVAALRLMPAVSVSRATFALRPAAVLGVVSEADSPPRAESAWPPQSVVQPAVAVSYDDPDLPSLFPRTDQIAQVAETAALASFDPYEPVNEALMLSYVGQSSVITATSGSDAELADASTREIVSESSESNDRTINEADIDRAMDPGPDAASRYPPLRLVERRIRSEPAERAAVDIPVVTTLVSGYGEAVDLLVGRGRWATASRALRAEVAAHERRRHRHDAARTSIALGRLHLAMGEVGPAARCFDRAGELASASGTDSEPGGSDHGAERLIGEALRWSGMAALDDADLERSERLLRSALAAIGPEADPHQVFAIELSLARCLFWQGRAREIVLPSPDALSPCVAVMAPGDGDAGSWASLSAIAGSRGMREFAGDASPHGRAAPSEAAPERAVSGRAMLTGASGCNHHDALATVILRVERWRRVARIALGDGDLSSAGDAIARACRIARGDDEDDPRSAGCRIDESVGIHSRTREKRSHVWTAVSAARRRAESGAAANAGSGATGRPDNDAANEVRVREALRAACHLDAARLQFAIGDTGSGDAHLRECLALSRVPARTARVQLLQLVQFRSRRTSEGHRRFERLSAALRQPRMPRLVRIQARYLIDPRSRRPQELVTFLDRHGDMALAGHGHADRRGGSPMLEAFQDVLRICHETPDDLTALARVSAYLRDQLRALSVAIYGAAPGNVVAASAGVSHQVNEGTLEANGNEERASPGSGAVVVVRYAVAGSTRVLSRELAMRAIDSGLLIPPTYRADALDAAAPVRYGGAPIGAIVVRWSIDVALDHTNASALISAAAAAISPHLRAALDRERPEAGASAADSRTPARTLGLLGISSAIDTLRHTITRVASAPFHVLIEGESGSGKELVAKALHQHGPRRHRRFCAVNCAALTDELLEAELFGHTRGAFTGALTERAGLFEEADGGTLFLDEIGELSPRGQAKLLRVIQDGETRRIGENLPRRVDTRIVAATNRSLRDEATAGQFRADLLYRLDVIRITVPALRARPEDVPVLARAFWDEAIARLGSRATLDPATLTALARYHWPGNVRELHNAIMALAVHAPPRGRVTPSLLPLLIRTCPVAASSDESDGASVTARDDDANDGSTDGARVAKARQAEREPLSFEGPLEDAKRAFESRYIRAALARAGGSPSRAARNLGLTRQGLKKLIARHGLDDAAAACRASPRRTIARKERSPP